jgi:hypothetical protein
MAAKRHMDIKRNITGHNIIIADITGCSLKKLCIRRIVLQSSYAPKATAIWEYKKVR